MNRQQFLDFAREKYSGDNLIAYRNLAIIELSESGYPIHIPNLRWSHIHFTASPFIQMRKASVIYPLPDSCRDALAKLLYGLWLLHSQTKMYLTDEIFCRNLQPIEGRQLNEAEKELIELDLDLIEVSRISLAVYQEAQQYYKPNRPKKQQTHKVQLPARKKREIFNSVIRPFAIVPETPPPKRAEAPGVLTSEEIIARNQKLEDARVEAEMERKRRDVDLSGSYSIFQQDPFYYPHTRARENAARIRALIENGEMIHAISVA